MLGRVSSAGYTALVWTIDLNSYGLRHRETRVGYEPPISHTTEELAYDPSISRDAVAWIREHAPGRPLLLKGILTAEDAAGGGGRFTGRGVEPRRQTADTPWHTSTR
jgi:isopentenyl diphosphate isomerase/L-lactate dehydrogenase-like FMN-dependent dehydrogenase